MNQYLLKWLGHKSANAIGSIYFVDEMCESISITTQAHSFMWDLCSFVKLNMHIRKHWIFPRHMLWKYVYMQMRSTRDFEEFERFYGFWWKWTWLISVSLFDCSSYFLIKGNSVVCFNVGLICYSLISRPKNNKLFSIFKTEAIYSTRQRYIF